MSEKPSMKIQERAGKHRFIHPFTPPGGIICQSFPVFSWATGCPYECSYCYLYLTLRMLPRMTVWTDYDAMGKQVERWAEKGPGIYLNAGELADSLAFGKYSSAMLKTVLPVIKRYPANGLYLLTKSNGEILADIEPVENVTVAFSINAEEVSALYEKDAPLPSERLKGAERLKKLGWRIRVRLDPMIPVEGWKKHYGDVIAKINKLRPEKVTLGSLRFNPALPSHCPPSDIWTYASEREAGNKIRVSAKTTDEMYRFALNNLNGVITALCKESPAQWKELNMGKLNCVCI